MNEYSYKEGFVPYAHDIISMNIETAVSQAVIPKRNSEEEKDLNYLFNVAISSVNAMNEMCAMLYIECMKKLGITVEKIDEDSLIKANENLSTAKEE